MLPGLGRSPGEGNGNPLQYSCLENSIDKEPGGLQSTGSQKSWTCVKYHDNKQYVQKTGTSQKGAMARLCNIRYPVKIRDVFLCVQRYFGSKM